MNKILAILVEPAQYTLDRNNQIYDTLDIDYIYLKGGSEASKFVVQSPLAQCSIFRKIMLLIRYLRHYDTIIVNGYNGIEFLILWILNFFFRKTIGIESDTPLRIPTSFFKKNCKHLYLRLIFSPSWLYGLAGGSVSHVQLFTYYGMPSVRVFLMPMVVDISKFMVCRQYSEIKDCFRFLYVGRFIPCKDLPVLLRAFQELHHKYPSSELVLVGDGVLMKALKKEWQHVEGIVFSGWKYGDQLLDFYKNADCLVLPSQFESWGLVVNEAMAAGLPVIISEAVGARWDLVDNKDTGLVFRTGNVSELRTAMTRMFEDHQLYRTYSMNAQHMMGEHWNFMFYKKCLEFFLNRTSKKV